jgi:hypothetical protein
MLTLVIEIKVEGSAALTTLPHQDADFVTAEKVHDFTASDAVICCKAHAPPPSVGGVRAANFCSNRRAIAFLFWASLQNAMAISQAAATFLCHRSSFGGGSSH